MSTRSAIGIKDGDGNIKGIYCHWDGYLENNGKILLENYKDESKVEELIELGDLSILGEEIGTKVDFGSFSSSSSKQCLAYGRDRGESSAEFKTFGDEQEFVDYFVDSDFYYLFKDNSWYWHTRYNHDDRTKWFDKLTPEVISSKDE